MCCIYYVNIDLCRQGHQCHQCEGSAVIMSVGCFHLHSSFLFVLLLYFKLSSRVLLLNFKHCGSGNAFGLFRRIYKVHRVKFFASYWSYHFSLPSWKRFSAIKITYYSNSVATFNLARLATSEDISLNPGPDCKVPSTTVKKSAWKFPCAICEKLVRCNQKSVISVAGAKDGIISNASI